MEIRNNITCSSTWLLKNQFHNETLILKFLRSAVLFPTILSKFGLRRMCCCWNKVINYSVLFAIDWVVTDQIEQRVHIFRHVSIVMNLSTFACWEKSYLTSIFLRFWVSSCWRMENEKQKFQFFSSPTLLTQVHSYAYVVDFEASRDVRPVFTRSKVAHFYQRFLWLRFVRYILRQFQKLQS